jgi:hypothetical protein
MKKPISPALHGIIDYAFSGLQITLPTLLKLPPSSRKLYAVLGSGFLATNTLTNKPVGLAPVISFKEHQKADAVFLAALSLLPLTPMIGKDRKSLIFHIGFFALAVSHYLLTDYEA